MMLKIFKTLNRPIFLRHSIHNKFCSAAQTAQTVEVVNKYLITRRPNENYSLYLDTDITVQEFKRKLEELFPTSKINLTNNKDYLITASDIAVNEDPNYEKIKKLPFIDTLLHNQLIAYEKNSMGQFLLTYGIQIAEYNLSNRLNIPEHVEQGIAQLNYQLSQHQMNIGNALSFTNIRKFHNGPLEKQSGPLINMELSQRQKKALNQSIQYLRIIKQIQDKIQYRSANNIMYGIIITMTANFGFLFYITYFYSGWDLGQPLSYLMGLGIDLIALLGVFEANKQLILRKQQDKNAYENTFNIRANEKMAKWRIAYLSRKISG